MQGTKGSFFLNTYFSSEKRASQVQWFEKITKNGYFSIDMVSYTIIKRLISKKGPFGALHLNMLFQTKTKFKYIERARTEKPCLRVWENMDWEKAKNIFRYIKKPLVFQKLVLLDSEIFREKMEVLGKIFIDFERADGGLFSYVFISISTILTKIDFFWVGGGP